ncbi:flagellar export chaperone FliS [Vallitaleaceae bacterium 9-2]
MTSNPYAKIKQNSVMTASAQDLTLMLYDGAIKYANQAIVAIEHKQYDVAHAKIMRVQDIIQEFIVTLDPNYEISTDMRRLYDYLYQRLVQANARKNVEIIEEVLGFLRDFRDTWKQAMELSKQGTQSVQVQ